MEKISHEQYLQIIGRKETNAIYLNENKNFYLICSFNYKYFGSIFPVAGPFMNIEDIDKEKYNTCPKYIVTEY